MLSQYDFNLSTEIHTFASQKQLTSIAQVIHLTTAILLILIGSILEYSRNIDFYVLLVSLSISIFKVFYGFLLLTNDEFSNKKFMDLNDEFPFELFFAIGNSVKYIQIAYIAKWINRRYLVIVLGLQFMFMGMSKWVVFHDRF